MAVYIYTNSIQNLKEVIDLSLQAILKEISAIKAAKMLGGKKVNEPYIVSKISSF